MTHRVVPKGMDTDRVVELVSTVVIIWMIVALAALNVSGQSLENALLFATAAALAVGLPFAALLIFVLNVDSSHVGPWDAGDLVFMAAVLPPLAGGVWAAQELGLGDLMYGVVVLFVFLVSVAFAVIVRDATVGEWPPGSAARRERTEGGPPGEQQ